MTKKERDEIRFSFQRYQKRYDKAMKEGLLREGIEKLDFDEYVSQYFIHKNAALSILEEHGKTLTVDDVIMSESEKTERPTLLGLRRLLKERGIKVSYDVLRTNQDRYFKMAREFYPDGESYDIALSNAYGWEEDAY